MFLGISFTQKNINDTKIQAQQKYEQEVKPKGETVVFRV